MGGRDIDEDEDEQRCVDCRRSIYPGSDRCGQCARNRARAPWLLGGAIFLAAIFVLGCAGAGFMVTVGGMELPSGAMNVFAVVGVALMTTIGALLKAYKSGKPKTGRYR